MCDEDRTARARALLSEMLSPGGGQVGEDPVAADAVFAAVGGHDVFDGLHSGSFGGRADAGSQ